MNEIKLIIADDHPIFRGGLKGIVEKERGFIVVAEAENGAEALEKIKQHAPTVAVLDLGVCGFVVKDGAASEIVDCIKTVAAGREYFSPAVSSHLLKRIRRASVFNVQAGIGDLTTTGRRVLFLLAELKTSKEIAAELGVSPRTIENHRAHICQKLELQGSHALTKFALRHKNELS